MEEKQLRVVAAVVKDGDRYLCTQRTRCDLDYITEHWEFPGGKVREGETDHEALLREIREELDWDIYVGKKIGTVNYRYPDFSIALTAYLCKGGEGDFKLLDHIDSRWLTREEMDGLKWTAADRELLSLL